MALIDQTESVEFKESEESEDVLFFFSLDSFVSLDSYCPIINLHPPPT